MMLATNDIGDKLFNTLKLLRLHCCVLCTGAVHHFMKVEGSYLMISSLVGWPLQAHQKKFKTSVL